MKALLLDEETTGIVSMVVAQSEIIAQEVFLVERIDTDRTQEKKSEQVNMHHLTAVCFVRPTRKVINHIKEHLASPKYKAYHIFFSNTVREEYLKEIARADELEVIKEVHEYYGDYYAVNKDLFHLNIQKTRPILQPEAYWGDVERKIFNRNVNGIASILLAMKKRPVVRYQRTSEICKRLSFEVVRKMKEEAELFHFQQGHSTPVLLILDRREDPVTPLLMNWTYQAMVHELIGITRNRVSLAGAPNVPKEMREVVLSQHQDSFFSSAMFLNYGDLGAKVKELVQSYQDKVKSNQQIQTIQQMTAFVENYPEFRQQQGNVSKHMAVLTEISRLCEARHLMDASECEQELACHSDHSRALELVMKNLEDPALSSDDRLRIVLLYALRYDGQKNQLHNLTSILRSKAEDERARKRIRAVDSILNYCGRDIQSAELFGRRDLVGKISSLFGAGLKGIENIYTQHDPLLSSTLASMLKGKLKNSTYPFVESNQEESKAQEIFVYMVGGVTYEEAYAVHKLNEENPHVHITLGGSTIHNSSSFLDDIVGLGELNTDEHVIDLR